MKNKIGLFQIAEAEEYTGVPAATLRYLRSQRRGPKSAILAGRIVYRQSDLDAWVNEQFEKDPTNH